MRRLKQQMCKVDGKSPYFRSPTKVERASLALRLVVLPPDGPARQPGRTGATPRSEIGRPARQPNTARVKCCDNCQSVTICHEICDKWL